MVRRGRININTIAVRLLILSVFIFISCDTEGLLSALRQEAEYAAAEEYTLTIEASSDAVVAPSGAMTVKKGFPVSISTVPNSGFLFTRWVKTGGTGTVVFDDETSESTTVLVSGANVAISPEIREIGDPFDEDIKINSEASYTTNAAVTLTLFADDDNGITEMRISENQVYANNNWIAYNTTHSFTLSAGDGTKTVYAWFKNASDKVSNSASATIILDTSAPSISTKTPTPGATGVARNTTITVGFNQSVDGDTITGSTFYLRKGATVVSSSVSYNSDTDTATLVPAADLDWNTAYTVTVTSGIEDAAGHSLTSGSNWIFTVKEKEVLLEHVGGFPVTSIYTQSATGTKFKYMYLYEDEFYATADSEESYGLIGKFNVSNPAAIGQPYVNDLTAGPQMIAKFGDNIYVTHDSGKVYKMDSFDLNESSTYGPDGYYGDFLNISSNNVLIQAGGGYLNGLFPGSLSGGHDLSSSDITGDFNDTTVMITNGNYTYLGLTDSQMDNTNSISIIDTRSMTNQGSVLETGAINITDDVGNYDSITDLAIYGGELLFVTHSENSIDGNDTGIAVLAVDDSANPEIVTGPTTALSALRQTEGIAISEYEGVIGQEYAIVTRALLGLSVIDLQNPSSPAILISSQTTESGLNAYKVLFDGQYAYVFEGVDRNTLTILNIYELSIY